MGIETYESVFLNPNPKPGDYVIRVNGKIKRSALNETQAAFYWASLNIGNGYRATLRYKGRLIARKS